MIGKTNAQQLGGGSAPTIGEYMVTVIDYDGTVLKQEFLNANDQFELPSAPNHTDMGLVFDGWSSPVTITNNKVTVTNSDITIGPMYYTASGKIEMDIVVGDGFQHQFGGGYQYGDTDWGDGTINSNSTHTYATGGKYTIKFLFKDNYLYPLTSDSNKRGHIIALRLPNTIQETYTEALAGSYGLQYVTMTKGITTFSTRLFSNCASLKAIVIPNTVTSCNTNTFNTCTNLKYIALPNTITQLEGSFYNCYNLKSITIPSSVTSLKSSVFYNCYSLEKLTIPNTVTTITDANGTIFNGLTALKKFNFLSPVSKLFKITARYLEEFTIPNTVTDFGGINGSYCLKRLTIPNTVTTMSGNLYSCYALEQVTLPNNITTIPSQMFQNCYILETINIPNTVTTLPSSSFYSCYCLKEITIPSLITQLNSNTFNSCYGLTKVVCLGDISAIADSSFYNCKSLTIIDLTHCTTVPTLASSSVFSGTPNELKIYVPASLEASWKTTTNWTVVATKIVGV